MERLFFLVSGEHPTLPFSEIASILEAGEYRYRALERLRQVFRVEAKKECVEKVFYRASMTRVCCQEFFNCKATLDEAVEALRHTSLDGVIERGDSFAVRVRTIGESSTDIVSVDLERKIGKMILEKVKGTKVKLKAPKHTFFGVLTERRFIFGLKLGEVQMKPFNERRPKKRPFFQPSAMSAKLARCMVNLTSVKEGNLVFDPFCGTATFLIEAGLMGCRVIGCDVKKHMVTGSLRNLKHYGIAPEAIFVADAGHPPIVKTDCIVTDPPYGRTASTLGKSTEQIVKKVLPEFMGLLQKKSRICIAAPKSLGVGKIAEQTGFKHLESHYAYVHRSLTREIAVLEKI